MEMLCRAVIANVNDIYSSLFIALLILLVLNSFLLQFAYQTIISKLIGIQRIVIRALSACWRLSLLNLWATRLVHKRTQTVTHATR